MRGPYLRPDGQVVWGHLTVTAVELKSTGLQLHLGLLEDISERKEAEHRLRESEERYRMLFNHIMDAILIIDLAGRLIDVNDVACLQYGYSREELLRLHVTDIDTPEDAVPRMPSMLRRGSPCWKTKARPASRHCTGTPKDGSFPWRCVPPRS